MKLEYNLFVKIAVTQTCTVDDPSQLLHLGSFKAAEEDFASIKEGSSLADLAQINLVDSITFILIYSIIHFQTY